MKTKFWAERSVLILANSARQPIRTIFLAKFLRNHYCKINLLGWVRNLQDIANLHEIPGARLQVLTSDNILGFLMKALFYLFRKSYTIYITMDIRMVPVILLQAKIKGGIALYDSKELPSLTAKMRVESLLAQSKWNFKSLKRIILSIYNMFESFCFRHVDGILCIDSREDFLYHRAMKLNGNAAVIMNVPDCDRSIVEKSFEHYNPIFGNFPTLVFSGGFFPDKGMKQYFNALRVLTKEFPDIKLIFCGRLLIPQAEFEDLIKANGVEQQVICLGYIPFHEHIGLLQSCKIGLALMDPDHHKFSQIGPGTSRKLFTYMWAGIPVITSNSHFARIVKEEDCGLAVDFNSHEDLVGAIRYLLTNEKERVRLGQNGLKAIELKYNMEVEGAKIERVIEAAFLRRTLVTSAKYFSHFGRKY